MRLITLLIIYAACATCEVPSFKCSTGSYSIDVYGNTGNLLQDSRCVCDKLVYAGCSPSDIQPVYDDIYDKYVHYEPSVSVLRTYPVEFCTLSHPYKLVKEEGAFGLPVTYVVAGDQKIKYSDWKVQCTPPNPYVYMYVYPVNATTCAYKKNIVELLGPDGTDGKIISCPEGCIINEWNGCTPQRNGTICGNISVKIPEYTGLVYKCPSAYHLIHLQSDTALSTHVCVPNWYYRT